MGNHKDLKNISSIYKTDKLEHGYIEIYESYFNQIISNGYYLKLAPSMLSTIY